LPRGRPVEDELRESLPLDSLRSLGTPLDSACEASVRTEAESNGLPRGRPARERRPNRVVRKGGFEPPRSCERQPLKLVRLPVPPLPQVGPAEAGHYMRCYCGGAGGCCAGGCCAGGCCCCCGCAGGVACGVAGVAGFAGAGGAGVPPTTEPGPRCPMIASAIASTMNRAARTAV